MNGPADGHGFTNRFHRGGQAGLGARELLESEARYFGDDIVNGRFKTGWRHLGDVIVQLIQRIAYGQLGGDFGNRKTGGLGSQRRAPRNPRVHLNHHHATVSGVHRPLHIGAAGLHADLAQHVDRMRPHHLVFFIRKR